MIKKTKKKQEPQVYFAMKTLVSCTRMTVKERVSYNTYVMSRALAVIIDTLIILSLLSLELKFIILATYGSIKI